MASSSVITNDTMALSQWTDSHCVSPVPGSFTQLPMFEDEERQYSMWSHAYSSTDSPSSPRDNAQPTQPVIKSELTSSPDFRLSRPSTVPPRPITHVNTTKAAISVSNYNTSINTRQDVPRFVVNTSASYQPSTATRSDVYSNHLRTSGSIPTPSHHVLNHPRQRLRTSNQVFSTPDLLAHYGLPSILPPAPSTAPRTQPVQLSHTAIPDFTDFHSLSSNYLNMLSKKPDNTLATNSTMPVETVSPADLQAPLMGQEQVNAEAMQSLMDIFAQASNSPVSPDLNTPELEPPSPDFGYDEFFTTSPNEDFLTTPVLGDLDDQMFTGFGDEYAGMSLFGNMEDLIEGEDLYEKQPTLPPPVPVANAKMYTISPASPMLHSFTPTIPSLNPSSIYPSPRLPSNLSSFPSPSPVPTTRRKSSATGTRKGVTPEALVPIDAPTQPRKYVTPSATSRKEVPSVFAKKRSRSQAFADEEDELAEEPLRPGATEKEQIEYKRRQNTVAARRSRKRKLMHQQHLEDTIEDLTRSRDVWKTRAQMFQDMLEAHGVPAPRFSDDEES